MNYFVEYFKSDGTPHAIPCKSKQDAIEMLRAIFIRSTLIRAFVCDGSGKIHATMEFPSTI